MLTAGGMALVVFVFATVLMLAAGLRRRWSRPGQRRQRRSSSAAASQTEVQSGIDRRQAGIVESLPDIAIGADGQQLVSKEPVVLINLPKRETGKPSNVVIRGVTPAGLALRPQVQHRRGPDVPARHVGDHRRPRRSPTASSGAGLGETLRFAQRDWTVVGVFDAGHTGFDSEIWGDAEQMMQAFRRSGFSSVIFRLADADRFDAVKSDAREPIRG